MFGDIGHAIVLICFGGYLVIAEKKFMGKKGSSEIFNIFFAGRYIILLMGIFSMYTGFVYNDIFSKSMNIFGSSWSVNMSKLQALELEEQMNLNPSFDYGGTPYFIGMDPIWQVQLFLSARLRLMLCFRSLRTRSYF
jgi:V-type H+-transporting ATPase subunit a